MPNIIIRRVTTSQQENIPGAKGTANDEVEKDIVVVKSGLMDANACVKALAEIYPRNTVLKVLQKDDNSDLEVINAIKGKKPIGVGDKSADED